jgi:hypothetical protein
MCGLGDIEAHNDAPWTAGIGDPGALAVQNHIHIFKKIL